MNQVKNYFSQTTGFFRYAERASKGSQRRLLLLLSLLFACGVSLYSQGGSLLKRLQEENREVVANTLPGVVKIEIEEFFEDSEGSIPWDKFFEQDNTKPLYGLGSGFIVEKDKNIVYILTNRHVVGKTEEVQVILNNTNRYKGIVIGIEERLDLALIKAEILSRDKVKVLPLADSDKIMEGDFVFAIGSPFGFINSVTRGIVSAIERRSGPTGNISDFIQTDASINRGNSGGVLMNIDSQVIGINTWISTPSGGSIGLGFSLPINRVKRFYRDIIDTGTMHYGWLGLSIQDLKESQLKEVGLNLKGGALVTQVFLDSPGDEAGILPGDIILRVNNKIVHDSDELVLFVGEVPPGTKASFQLHRDGKLKSMDVILRKRESVETDVDDLPKLWPGLSLFSSGPVLGLEVTPSKEMPKSTGSAGLPVQSVIAKSPAFVAGFRENDRIISVDGVAVKGVFDFYYRLGDGKSKDTEIEIQRGQKTLTLILKRYPKEPSEPKPASTE